MTLETANWAREDLGQEQCIREQLLGLATDSYSAQLHERLRGEFDLPDWERLLFAPETTPGVRFISRVGLAGYGCATIVPFAGGELELYRAGGSSIGTLYSFALDWREGIRLLGGLGMERLSGIAFWFGKRSAEVAVTFAEYLAMINQAALTLLHSNSIGDHTNYPHGRP